MFYMEVKRIQIRWAIRKIGSFVIVLLIIALAASVVFSGYHYVFDTDELLNAHMVYLIDQGYQPFVSFFSVYSPVYHWFLLPLFHWLGYSIETVGYARILMIVVMASRTVGTYAIVKLVFGKRVALIATVFLLLDPFTVFSGMQLRPDNLMLLFLIAGLYALTVGLMKPTLGAVFVSGVFFSLSFLTSIKILPSILATVGVLVLFVLRRRKVFLWNAFFFGLLLPIGFFVMRAWADGSYVPMVQQLTLDARLTNQTRAFPTAPGFFYLPDNTYIYGVAGRPLHWVFALFTPLLSAIGLSVLWRRHFTNRLTETTWIIGSILAISLVFQTMALLVVRSVFVQYYLPVTAVVVIFAAVGLEDLLADLPKKGYRRLLPLGFILSSIALVSIASIRANISRSTYSWTASSGSIIQRLTRIPVNTPVFPSFLFRPLSYPIPYGYFVAEIPQAILSRYPSFLVALTRLKSPFLLVSDYHWRFLDEETQRYISSAYEKDASDAELWVRRENIGD